jgi:hypothetical protein
MTKLFARLLSKRAKSEEQSEQDIVQMALLMRMDRVMQAQANQRHNG